MQEISEVKGQKTPPPDEQQESSAQTFRAHNQTPYRIGIEPVTETLGKL